MYFTIDGKRIGVAIAARPLILDGQPCRAKLDRAHWRIWLSDQLPRHERRRELFHELRHAWVDARGLSADPETDARLSAEWADEMLSQFQGQGGDDVLEALNPEAEATARLNRQPVGLLARTEIVCGFCGAPVACGSIDTSGPQWVTELSVWATDRAMCCPACDSVTAWRETSTAEGMPTGQLIPHPPPRVLNSREAREWLAQHQELCRVRMLSSE